MFTLIGETRRYGRKEHNVIIIIINNDVASGKVVCLMGLMLLFLQGWGGVMVGSAHSSLHEVLSIHTSTDATLA